MVNDPFVAVDSATGTDYRKLKVDADGKLLIASDVPLEIRPSAGTLTDISGSATTTSSQVVAANSDRSYFFIQNSSGGAIWINFGTAAVTAPPSIELKPNDTFVMEDSFISTEAINVMASSGTRAFTAKEA